MFAAVLLFIAGKGAINEDLDGSFFLLFKDQMNKCCNIMDEENPFEHHIFFFFCKIIEEPHICVICAWTACHPCLALLYIFINLLNKMFSITQQENMQFGSSFSVHISLKKFLALMMHKYEYKHRFVDWGYEVVLLKI